jgi:hypothetical protein
MSCDIDLALGLRRKEKTENAVKEASIKPQEFHHACEQKAFARLDGIARRVSDDERTSSLATTKTAQRRHVDD